MLLSKSAMMLIIRGGLFDMGKIISYFNIDEAIRVGCQAVTYVDEATGRQDNLWQYFEDIAPWDKAPMMHFFDQNALDSLGFDVKSSVSAVEDTDFAVSSLDDFQILRNRDGSFWDKLLKKGGSKPDKQGNWFRRNLSKSAEKDPSWWNRLTTARKQGLDKLSNMQRNPSYVIVKRIVYILTAAGVARLVAKGKLDIGQVRIYLDKYGHLLTQDTREKLEGLLKDAEFAAKRRTGIAEESDNILFKAINNTVKDNNYQIALEAYYPLDTVSELEYDAVASIGEPISVARNQLTAVMNEKIRSLGDSYDWKELPRSNSYPTVAVFRGKAGNGNDDITYITLEAVKHPVNPGEKMVSSQILRSSRYNLKVDDWLVVIPYVILKRKSITDKKKEPYQLRLWVAWGEGSMGSSLHGYEELKLWWF